jgi:hypothetical protein
MTAFGANTEGMIYGVKLRSIDQQDLFVELNSASAAKVGESKCSWQAGNTTNLSPCELYFEGPNCTGKAYTKGRPREKLLTEAEQSTNGSTRHTGFMVKDWKAAPQTKSISSSRPAYSKMCTDPRPIIGQSTIARAVLPEPIIGVNEIYRCRAVGLASRCFLPFGTMGKQYQCVPDERVPVNSLCPIQNVNNYVWINPERGELQVDQLMENISVSFDLPSVIGPLEIRPE